MDEPPNQAVKGKNATAEIMSHNKSNYPELRQPVSTIEDVTVHGLKLWLLISGLFMGVFLVGLDMTMLSTVSVFLLSLTHSLHITNFNFVLQVAPKLTNYFGTVKDVSWYETAYTISV